MTALDKVVEYMRMKASLSNPIYFTPKDLENLKGYSDELHRSMWKIISNTREGRRFTSKDCPFCIQCIVRCTYCDYKKIHGRCSSDFSDWTKYISPTIHTKDTTYVKLEILRELQELVDSINSLKHAGEL